MKIKPELYQVQLENTSVWGCKTPEKLVMEIAKFSKFDYIDVKEIKFEEGKDYYNLVEDNNFVLSKDQIIDLSIDGIKFSIKQVIDVSVDITAQLIELAEKPVKIAMESSGGGNVYNNKCEVHMPGNMLAMYNEMQLLSDACTDALQSSLNSGWRIVAVCPQPDQRRPDYILGRFNPNYEAQDLADRGMQM